jgi:hypothetical protein
MPSLTDKLAELVETVATRNLQPTEAQQLLAALRQTYPEFEKFLQRRFARLSEAQQQILIRILQAAQADDFRTMFTRWSSDPELSIPVRVYAMTALERLGGVVDQSVREGLWQAEHTLQQLKSETPMPVAEDGQLLPALETAVQQLPLGVALDLVRALSTERPQVALAVVRSRQGTADTKTTFALVDCLAHIPLLDSVAILRDIMTGTTDKTIHKAVKKAWHQLKARGLDFAAEPPRQHAMVGSGTHRLEQCLASHIDPNGDRALWLIRTRPFGGYYIAYLIINYGTGIQVAMGLQATKRELPDLLAKAQERVRLIDIPPTYGQALVALAQQMNLDTRTPVPEEFFALRDIIGEAESPFDTALIHTVLTPEEHREAEAYESHASDLLTLPEFAGWTLPATTIQKYADQIREIEDSQIVVSATLKQERIQAVCAQALEEVLGERTRWLMRLRLEEMAYYLLHTDRRREALWALAAAQSLSTDNAERLRHNPFAGALLERSLDVAKSRPGSRIIQPFARGPVPEESRRLII